jgi:methylated-DNA-protein-cysteine methyltransferase related protein
MAKSNLYQRIYNLVRKIPKGKVATYGQIAALAGSPRAARIVGYALHIINENSDVPWQRVINRQGIISTTCQEHPPSLQADILIKEGVVVKNRNGLFQIDLKKYLWWP